MGTFASHRHKPVSDLLFMTISSERYRPWIHDPQDLKDDKFKHGAGQGEGHWEYKQHNRVVDLQHPEEILFIAYGDVFMMVATDTNENPKYVQSNLELKFLASVGRLYLGWCILLQTMFICSTHHWTTANSTWKEKNLFCSMKSSSTLRFWQNLRYPK